MQAVVEVLVVMKVEVVLLQQEQVVWVVVVTVVQTIKTILL